MTLVKIAINPIPDGFGYYYGDAYTSMADLYRINYLPSKSEWCGDIKPNDLCDEWIVYIDGREVAKARSKEACDEIVRFAIS